MGDLIGLENLDLPSDGCKRLEALPERLDDMKGLKNIILGSCSTLTGLSERLRALGMRSKILQEPCKRFEPTAPKIIDYNLGLMGGVFRTVTNLSCFVNHLSDLNIFLRVPQDVRCFRRFEGVATVVAGSGGAKGARSRRVQRVDGAARSAGGPDGAEEAQSARVH